MRRSIAVLVSLVVLAAFAITASGQEPTPAVPTTTVTAPSPAQIPTPPVPKQKPCPTRWDHRKLLRKALRYRVRGVDYTADAIHEWPMKMAGRARGCARERHNWSALRQEKHDLKVRLKTYWFYKHIDQITPYGAYAIPAYIVMRESRGDPCARNSSSTAGGLYQFLDGTWYAYGGSSNGTSYPAACAPAWEQHEVAARAWAGGAGSSHWALTR